MTPVRTASSSLLAWSLLPTFIGYLLSFTSVDVPMPPVGEGCLAVAPTPDMLATYDIEMANDFNVTAVCCNAYSFTGSATGSNPTLTLTRGVTYTFGLTGGVGHPFAIRATAGGSNIAGPFTAATFTFTPDFVMPTNMVYQCTIHSPMLGNIVLVNPNSPPSATNLSAAETYTEDTPLNLVDIVVGDVDNTTTTATLTLSNPSAGSLNTATSGAVTSTYNAGTGVWTASGAIANVNSLLAGLIFTPALNFNGSFTIATSVSDGIASVTGTKSMTGTAVNDAPTASNLSAAESYTEDTPLNFVDIVVSDVDNVNVTATLTLSNPSAGSLNTATSGAVTSTYNAGTGVWTASGAIANVNSLLAGLIFTPALNFNGSFTIATSVSDGVAAALTGTKAITGTAVNDAPTASNLSAAESYTEDTPLNFVDIVVSDVDNVNVTATLTLSNPSAGSLNTATSGAVTSTYNAGTGVWTASGAIANVNSLLAGLIFTPALNFNGSFTIATSVSDGVAAALTGTKAITGTPANDPPACNVPGPQTTAEDTPYAFTGGNSISVGDVDSGTLTVSLSVTSGTMTMTTLTGLSFTIGDGTADGSMSFSGSLSALNNALGSASFTPLLNFNGSALVTVAVSDGALSAPLGTIDVTVTPVNDAPTASGLNAPQNYSEDVTLNLLDIVISDVDNALVTATLTLSNTAVGSLSTGTSGAVTSTFSAGVWSASGALSNVNALLAALTFTPTPDFNGNFTIATSVSDGIAAPVAGSKTMTGIAVNDAPTAANLNAAEDFGQNLALALIDIVASDVDNANVTATLTFSDPSAGSLNAGTSGAVTSTFSAGVWSASGATADVNALLADLIFSPSANYFSAFTMTTSVSDGILAATGSKAFTPVVMNHAPVLVTWINPMLTNMAEDAGVPTGPVGTLVSDVVDLESEAGGLDNVVDQDAGALAGMAVISTDAINGVWYYSLDNGDNWQSLGSPSPAAARLLAADAGTRVYFQPDPDWYGASYLSFVAWDRTTGANGGAANTSFSPSGAFSVWSENASIGVLPVNDAPTASNLDAAEAYTQDTPLDLVDIVTGDVDNVNLTATLTLSNPAAGSLSTATSGAVTSTFALGVWQASGAIADVNTLLAAVTYVPSSGFISAFSIASSVSDGAAAPLTGSKAMTGTATSVSVAARVFLEGAYSASTGLMSDALRSAGALPTSEPFAALGYTHSGGGGGESTTAPVLAVSGNDAITDWVLLELRDIGTPSTILASHGALVQRDGHVVGMDGTSAVSFSVPPGGYYVAVRHRNHLGCMTGSAVALSSSPTTIDFTSAATSIFGTAPVKSISGAFPTQALWAGDVSFNGQVKYTGSNNDRDPILVTVGSTTPNNVVTNAYSTRDVNMNAEVKYTGSGNDRDPILVNVGSTTPNNTRTQQLP